MRRTDMSAGEEWREGEPPLPDALPGIDLEAGLARVVGDRRLLRSLLVQFGREHATTSGRLREEIASGRYADAERRVHQLKGIAGNLAIFAVAASAQALCDAVRGDRREALGELLARLEEDMEPALDSCASLTAEGGARSEGAAATLALSDAELHALLKELAKLLRSFNTRAEERAAVLQRALAGSPHLLQAREISGAIERFDFKRAQVVLEELRAAIAAPL